MSEKINLSGPVRRVLVDKGVLRALRLWVYQFCARVCGVGIRDADRVHEHAHVCKASPTTSCDMRRTSRLT